MRFSFGNENSVEKVLKQAEKYVQQGKFGAAVDEYQKVLESNPNDTTLLNTIGDLCVRANRNDDAIRYFQHVAANYEREGGTQGAIAVYKKIAKLDGGHADTAVKLGELYCKQGLISDARVQFAVAANVCKQAGDKQRAFKVQQKIADIDPENVSLRLELAAEYERAGFPKEAYQAFIQAAQELHRRNRVDESLEAFQKALALRPDSKIALNALGEGYAQQGKVTEALKLIDGLLTKNPDDPDLVSILGRTYLNAGMLDEAESTFARLGEIDRTRSDALIDVGRHYVEAGNYERAIRIVDRCADSLIARGMKKRVTALRKDMLKRDRTNIDALKHLADVYTRVDERRNLVATLNTLVEVASRGGMTDEATAALKRLMDVEPDAVAEPKAAAKEPAAPVRANDPSNFPPGFESGPTLLQWNRESGQTTLGTSEYQGEQRDDEYFVPGGAGVPDASASASSEYSMELVDDMVSAHPEFRSARIKLLEELVAGQPTYLAGRAKLKKLYADSGMRDKAAAQCLEMAKLHQELGETDKAKECVAEAYELNPSVDNLAATASAAPSGGDETLDLAEMFTISEFGKYFDREWRRAIRDAKTLSLVKVEIDAFNDYVDTYGLLSGDYCLERVAGTLESDLLRPGDMISSAGGGIFLVLLPDTPEAAVGIVANRLRSKVVEMRIQHQGSATGDWVTVSVGAASAVPHPKYSSDVLLVAADDALVQAKVEGGNRVVVAPLITN